MRTKIAWEEEYLDNYSWRVAVIGGWIVYTRIENPIGGHALTSCFISDRDHEWIIKKPCDQIKPSVVMEEFKSPTE